MRFPYLMILCRPQRRSDLFDCPSDSRLCRPLRKTVYINTLVVAGVVGANKLRGFLKNEVGEKFNRAIKVYFSLWF